MDGLTSAIIVSTIIVVSLSVHEAAHAAVANLFGDPTARLEGRLTLNPIKHWDPIGTTLLVGLIFLASFGLPTAIFGWGKPVPVDERNFDNPKLHGLQTALAGPMSNLLLAFVLGLVVRFGGFGEAVDSVLMLGIYINVFLMFFNLIPVPPLDGSRILRLFISEQTYYWLSSNIFIFVALIFIVITFVLDFVVRLATNLTSLLAGV